jgi:diguanylate cyclase (GGDEF)-like protein/PAS domain S-box-containing protein
MSFSTLQRLALFLVFCFFGCMAWLSIQNSRQSGVLLDHFVSRHIQAGALLHDIDNSLTQARRSYENLLADRSGSVNDCVSLLDTISGRLKMDPGVSQELVSGIALDLARIRSGLLQIDEMRSRGDYSDSMSKARSAVENYLTAAQASAEQLAFAPSRSGDAVFFLNNSLEALNRTVSRYLQAKPDQLPILTGLLERILKNIGAFWSLEHYDGDTENLREIEKHILVLKNNIPRIRRSLLADPNFALNTSKAELQEINRHWDDVEIYLQVLKTIEANDLHEDSTGIRDTLAEYDRVFLVVSMGCLAFAVLGMLVIRRLLVTRVKSLKMGTELIANGQFDHRLPVGPMDHFGDLAAAFNSMARRLQEEQAVSAKAMEELRSSHELLDQRVRERTNALSEALESLRLKESVFSHSMEGFVVCDESLRILDANPAMAHLTGYSPASLIGLTPDSFCSQEVAEPFRTRLHNDIERSGRFDGEIDILTRDGRTIPLQMIFARLSDDASQNTHYIGICRNMAGQRQAEEQLQIQASQDQLTGLPNRSMMLSELATRLGQAQNDGHLLAVFLLDLDNFKNLNDCSGHPEGDALLRLVAERLNAQVRAGDLVARLGGDEFAVVATELTSEDQASALAKRVLDCFLEPFEVPGGAYKASASLGLTIFPRDGSDPDTLLRNADMALHRAKNLGKGKVDVYTEELDSRIRTRIAMEKDLRDAVEQRRFEVHYQPIVRVNSPEITGAEALLRWNRDGEPMSPALFIPLCEEMNLMPEITSMVLEKVLEDIVRWDAQGVRTWVSMNISAVNLSEPGFPFRLSEALASRGLESSRVGLEITETAIMRNPGSAAEVLRSIRDAGHRVSVDDFGTGYSSLRYLQQFPLTSLKIDRQFIKDLETVKSREIVKATLAMAKSLGISVIAEGVETSGQLDFLRTYGCDYYQGYLCSPALPAGEFAAFVRRITRDFDKDGLDSLEGLTLPPPGPIH